MIDDHEVLLEMGLNPLTSIGHFSVTDLHLLIDFCRAHSEYHIITSLDILCSMNRPHRDAYFYYLGDGDNDPTIELQLPDIWDKALKGSVNEINRRY